MPQSYSFPGKLLQEGNRFYIPIPFNVWETCKRKGILPVQVNIQTCTFACKLIPKGNGIYYIPIKKSNVTKSMMDSEFPVSFELVSSLTRINHSSPYSKEHPIIRKQPIQQITYPKRGYCGQLCIAMLTGVPVEEIIDLMNVGPWQCSFSILLETLDYCGIAYQDKITYTRGKEVNLPECCIINFKEDKYSHFSLYDHGTLYDSRDLDFSKIICYLEIIQS